MPGARALGRFQGRLGEEGWPFAQPPGAAPEPELESVAGGVPGHARCHASLGHLAVFLGNPPAPCLPCIPLSVTIEREKDPAPRAWCSGPEARGSPRFPGRLATRGGGAKGAARGGGGGGCSACAGGPPPSSQPRAPGSSPPPLSAPCRRPRRLPAQTRTTGATGGSWPGATARGRPVPGG